MKKISFVVGKDYLNNKIFDVNNPTLNRDDCLRAYHLLRKRLSEAGIELATQDIINPSTADLVIYNEMPKPFLENIDKNKSILLVFETDLIRPDNWDMSKHAHFKKIFTWNDELVDGKKYFKFNFPNTFKKTTVDEFKRPKFLTLISGNKTCNHEKELYSERLKVIRWFERNHPLDFDYFGIGWEYSFSLWWQKVFRKLKVLNYMPKSSSPCYKGRVNDKFSTLKNYQFAICYENGKEIPGYITEKIMDCFFAGCIPIYLGASNIEKHIPNNTFIDRRKFQSMDELYNHLKEMPLSTIQNYQIAILDFLESTQGQKFSNESFVETVVAELI